MGARFGSFRARAAATAGAAFLALSIVLGSATPSDARSVANDKAAADKGRDRHVSRIIISIPPRQEARIHTLLSKAVGTARGEKLGASQFEVWTVPTARLDRLARRLNRLGISVMHLPDDWNHILQLQQGPAALSAAQDEFAKKARASPEFVGMGMMKAPHAAISEYALTVGAKMPAAAGSRAPEKSESRIVIPINGSKQVIVQRTHTVTSEKGSSWRGTVEETGENALLMWWKDGRISGVFSYKGRIYSIVNAGSEVHAVIETDPKKMPPDHAPATSDRARALRDRVAPESEAEPSPPAAIKPFSDAERRALEAKKIVIDLMILYTKKAESHYMRGPADIIELAVEQANQSFRNSGIGNVSLRLVHMQAIDYDEGDALQFDHLYRMVDGVGAFKDVRRLRDHKRADIVGLVLQDPSGCGLSTRVGADAEEAYFVVHHACATLTISMAHEIGHILGARHDRTIDQSDSPFPYGHGYVNGSKWRCIMSYHKGCDGCPRIPFWSNPRINYQGEPTGTPAEDTARLVLEQAERVAKFR